MGDKLKKIFMGLPGIRSIVWKYQRLDKKIDQELKSRDCKITENDKRYRKIFAEHQKRYKKSELQIIEIYEQLSNLREENEKLKKWIQENQNNNVKQLKDIKAWCEKLEKDDEYYYYKGLEPKRYEKELEKWFKANTGENLDLEHPKTYNQIIQWTKLRDIDDLKVCLADKYLGREWVAERIGQKYLIPLLGVWERVEDIDFDQLPDKFVIKANHGCGYNIIVRDKKTFNKEEARKKIRKWLVTDFAFRNGFELQYTYISPRIIVEEYLENQNEELNDYKVFCFHGKAKYIMFLSNRREKLKMAFYDLDWKLQPFTYSYERNDIPVDPPENLAELVEISEKLAKDFIQVRVDFYRTNEGEWKFGEMTFTSASGRCEWNPPEYNEILGSLIHIDEGKSENIHV